MSEPRMTDEMLLALLDGVWSGDHDAGERLIAEARRAREAEATRPTAWAYEQACAATEKHRARADKAEAERDHYIRMAEIRIRRA
jgi:hypothetical protein